MNENLLEKKAVRTVIDYLQNFDPNLFLISLDTTARTAKDASISLNVEVGAIVKSLVFKIANKNIYYLCLVSGDKLVSLKKLSLNTPTQIFIDSNLKRFEKIYAAAGNPYVVFGITYEQICQITNGKIIDFVE